MKKVSVVTTGTTILSVLRDVLLCIALVFYLVGSQVSESPKVEDCMIEFTKAANQYISFGDILGTLTEKTFFIVVDIDTLPVYPNMAVLFDRIDVANGGWILSIYDGYIAFIQTYTITDDYWITTSRITAPGKYVIVATYNNSAKSATVRVNGASMSMAHVTTGNGVLENPSNPLLIGGDTVWDSIDGRLGGAGVYDVILSAEEQADISASRKMIVNDRHLVFHALCDGASGLSSFDGATLAAGNLIVDRISGALGTPFGDPLGYADDYMAIGD